MFYKSCNSWLFILSLTFNNGHSTWNQTVITFHQSIPKTLLFYFIPANSCAMFQNTTDKMPRSTQRAHSRSAKLPTSPTRHATRSSQHCSQPSPWPATPSPMACSRSVLLIHEFSLMVDGATSTYALQTVIWIQLTYASNPIVTS